MRKSFRMRMRMRMRSMGIRRDADLTWNCLLMRVDLLVGLWLV
jgi:hypothetical protein